ncbi:MAG: M61 family peptidase [Bacteroidetes bacterium]|nr:M61 family peptidase [Bacteroidota bacterium]
MTTYQLSIKNPHQQYIQFEVQFVVSSEMTQIKLPTWRPGRYELGNFAKNVREFEAVNSQGKKMQVDKINTSTWEVNTKGLKTIKVRYQYYSTELNAGSTFLSKEQLYVNPVNCFCYTDETAMNECQVELLIPEDYEIACQLPSSEHILKAKNFDELADSPFIASATLLHDTYEVAGTIFHLWFQGIQHIDWDKIKKDFALFTEAQLKKFTEFPTKEYHFLFQIVPYKAYHGVEHCASTVILLGPTYAVFKGFYNELLGVSSHELYHTWNVKAIRPIEMYPYDFSKENFSTLGFLCEGVTTYMGDLFLWKSGVFKEEEYFKELENQLQKHFDNFGRFHSSVALSSQETWLDGYVPGAPGRKVSIYTEGCLLALMTDVRILFETKTRQKYGLDEVMRRLYFDFALKGKGVSEDDYFEILESITQSSWKEWREDYFHGTKAFEVPLYNAFERLGIELLHSPSKSYKEAKTGIKTQITASGEQITSIYVGSPADMAGLMIEDTIVAVNKCSVQGDLDNWLTYFDDEDKILTIQRKGQLMEFQLPELNRTFFNTYTLKKVAKPDIHQRKTFEYWGR